MMEWMFGSKKTPQELLRQHQRSLQRAMRELDRERQKLEQQDKKLVADIKKAAKEGQNGACKVMAKDLVRTRRHVEKFYQMKTQLQGVSLRIQTMKSHQAMSDAMKGVTKAMRQMNGRIQLPAIQKIMMDFEKESAIMDMKEEMMGDAMDDAMDEPEDEEETDQIVAQVLDEIGISVGLQLAETPAEPQKVLADEDRLQARLDNLRRD